MGIHLQRCDRVRGAKRPSSGERSLPSCRKISPGASPTPAFSQGIDDSAEPLCRFFSKCEIPISVSAIVYIGTQMLVKQPH